MPQAPSALTLQVMSIIAAHATENAMPVKNAKMDNALTTALTPANRQADVSTRLRPAVLHASIAIASTQVTSKALPVPPTVSANIPATLATNGTAVTATIQEIALIIIIMTATNA